MKFRAIIKESQGWWIRWLDSKIKRIICTGQNKMKSEDLPMPEWQKRELDERYKEYNAGGQNLHDWQPVHEDLRNNYK